MSHVTVIGAEPASAGLGFTVTGWAAVTALAITVLGISALTCWVLASASRTTRLTRIINALRRNDTCPPRTHVDARARRDKTLAK